MRSQTPIGFRPHERRFVWGAVPPELPQAGHSGAPILKDGKIVALFVGSEGNSFFCAGLSGCRWHALVFVSVATIRARYTLPDP